MGTGAKGGRSEASCSCAARIANDGMHESVREDQQIVERLCDRVGIIDQGACRRGGARRTGPEGGPNGPFRRPLTVRLARSASSLSCPLRCARRRRLRLPRGSRGSGSPNATISPWRLVGRPSRGSGSHRTASAPGQQARHGPGPPSPRPPTTCLDYSDPRPGPRASVSRDPARVCSVDHSGAQRVPLWYVSLTMRR